MTEWRLVDDVDRAGDVGYDSFESARGAAGVLAADGQRVAVFSFETDDDGEVSEAVVWTSTEGYGGGSLSWPPVEGFHERATAAGLLWHPVQGYYEPDDVLEEHATGQHDEYPDVDACTECARDAGAVVEL